MSRRALMWVLAALLGILITAAVTWAASLLTGQHIGLYSEPLSSGSRLVPHVREPESRQVPPPSKPPSTATKQEPDD